MKVLTDIQFRFFSRSIEDSLRGTCTTIRTLQYAKFFYDSESKTEDQEAEWIDIPEVSEADELAASKEHEDAIEAAGGVDEMLQLLEPSNLPMFLKQQAD